MAIVWDEPKRAANLAKHGLDFADFDTAFDGEGAVYLPAKPGRSGRARYKLIGLWQGEVVVAVIVSPLGTEALSIISLRRASQQERNVYDPS